MWKVHLFFGTLTLFTSQLNAERVSYRLAHPIAWMHALPAGESPGWSTQSWLTLELNQANIWGTPLSMEDRRSGKIYEYQADYEQTSAIANLGFAFNEKWALAIEVPYANHNGGFLDQFIDQFHVMAQTDRFQRNSYLMFQNQFHIKTDGVNRLRSQHAEGVGNIKTKAKYWLWQKKSPTPGACDCGFSISAHVKTPVQSADRGLTSGHADYSGMLNLGLPFGEASGFWLSSALTYLNGNQVLMGWPTRQWHQMYELSLNLGLTTNWSLLLQGRYESPLLQQEHLDFQHQTTTPRNQAQERSNSGWNSLVYWRGSQSMGFNYRWGKGSSINLLFVEDWGRGKYDSSGAITYINNAPDVQFLSQLHILF